MFDGKYGKYHMYHSEDCSVGQGIDVTFMNPIKVFDFIVHSRRDCCRDRYLNVCLYADDEKVGCSPSSDYTPGDQIKFMDFRTSRIAPLTGSSFKLKWGTAGCAQIEELYIYYSGIYNFYQ